MKIYFPNINISSISLETLDKYKSREEHQYNLYSDSGVYRITNGDSIHQISFIDGNIETSENYLPSQDMILDTTIVKKINKSPSHLPNDYYKEYRNVVFYALREKSPLFLVVEKNATDNIEDIYFMLYGNYAAYSSADLNNHSIKEDFQDFFNMMD